MPLSDLDATVVANTRLSSDLSRAFQVAFSRSSSLAAARRGQPGTLAAVALGLTYSFAERRSRADDRQY